MNTAAPFFVPGERKFLFGGLVLYNNIKAKMRSNEKNMEKLINKVSKFVFLCAIVAVAGCFFDGTADAQSSIALANHDLTVGSKGVDVQDLQRFLNGNGFKIALIGPGSSGQETLVFGYATKTALAKFQAAHGIIATGYFGSKTRAYLASLAGGGLAVGNGQSSVSDNKNEIIKSQISALSQKLNSLMAQLGALREQSVAADTVPPRIIAVNVSNAGNGMYLGPGSSIIINFSEPIDPRSINSGLSAGGTVSGISSLQTGGVSVIAAGEVIIGGITDFSVGSVSGAGIFGATLALDPSAKILTVTLTSGNNIMISSPKLSPADQIGGAVKDARGNVMASVGGVVTPGGAFSGGNSASFITAINVSNGGQSGYLDDGDSIAITFDHSVDPKSINSDLSDGGNVSNVLSSQTGGVSVNAAGEVVVNGIVDFGMGSVVDSGNFGVNLALNSTGKILTVALANGRGLRITAENFSAAYQIGGTIRDENGYVIVSENAVVTPTGSFGGTSIISGSIPYISAINVSNGGKNGYIDNGDTIAVVFNEAIDPKSINANLSAGVTIPYIASTQTGGVSISSSGVVAVNGIADFNMGSASDSGKFVVKMTLDPTGRILTLTLTSGSDIGIANESFAPADQIGGTVKDGAGNVMAATGSILTPAGTFGGQAVIGSDTTPPYITSIGVANGGATSYLDGGDTITIGFSEPINPKSINGGLGAGDYVTNVPSTQAGGVTVSSSGEVIINKIADFYMGSVSNSSAFAVQLALDSTGKYLTIILIGGSDVQITKESFGRAYQIGGTAKDVSGNKMVSQTTSFAPTGTFGGTD
jgi:hypothetical protein